ncbi:glycosyltransferase [Pseudobacteriovorax antillogorgiicola]|uniref:Glycosyltransferase involved in cell wall bisynthesis n=1 Tax=Pseudobacteriovorax antillogorgiicola TaxID=1513793 RepID=A0A1Y6CT72_9BACT|nr:glycosyltransferase [Pseudobacteriovorax antillogorgiicola]TCS45224.1 glycosyltransferase involved in cell wall biosynthesis [Pseudobacteriovorax antillogorgiicola]SMF75395.1 Glycosyltransferase involved in cell wall bisynthesis [Pseudobacteriovorax antillogorgiicola]
MKTLYVLTNNFPFTFNKGECTFLEKEHKFLEESFDRVIYVPLHPFGEKAYDVCCDLRLSKLYQRPKLIAAVLGLFSGTVADFKKSVGAPYEYLKLYLNWSWQANVAELWTNEIISAEKGEQPFFYSWWFVGTTLGCARALKKMNHQSPIVTRAHGYDLYPEDYGLPDLPFRRQSIELVDFISPDSLAGSKYLISKFPEFRHKIGEHLLGIEQNIERYYDLRKGRFTICSCSSMIDLKRVDLIAESVVKVCKSNSETNFYWRHFGDGPDRYKVESILKKSTISNLEWELQGHVPSSEILEFYKSNDIDLFLHLSRTEGTPVALIEAIAHSIPVLSTSAGGCQEIVNNKNGKIIPINCSADRVASEISSLLSRPGYLQMRINAHRTWRTSYNAEINYRKFCSLILGLYRPSI